MATEAECPPKLGDGSKPRGQAPNLWGQPKATLPLPERLVALVKRAARNELPNLSSKGLATPLGSNFYTLAWATSYFLSGDPEHALLRLERVYQAQRET